MQRFPLFIGILISLIVQGALTAQIPCPTPQISGTFTYDNAAGTPLIYSMVYLKSPSGVALDSCTVDPSGHYGFCQVQEQIDIKPVRNWIMGQAGIGILGDFHLKSDLGSTYDYYLIKPNLCSIYELNWQFHIKRKMSINTGLGWSRNRYTNTVDFNSGNPFTIDSMKFTLSWGDRYDLLYFPLEIAFHTPINKTLEVIFKAGVCGNYLDYDVTTSGLVKNHTDTIFKGIFTLNKTDKIFMSLRASLGLNFYISKNFSITLNGAYVYSNKKIMEGRIYYLINNQSVSQQKFSQKLKQFQIGFGLRISIRSVSKLFY